MSTGDLAGRKLHLIAIGGAGMSALALAARALGAEVSGSDRAESSYLRRLRDAGLHPYVGHDPDRVPDDAEVVVSTAIGEDNPELVRARERGQRILHRSELLAELCATGRLIAVAGAHGKTTTSGMIAHALRQTGAEPSYLLGGELPGADGVATNAEWGRGEWIIAEADESDGSFLRLAPEVAAITNVELDHHSHWRGEAELRRAFAEFRARAERGVVLAEPRLDSLTVEGDLRFGLEGGRPGPAPDLIATGIEAAEGGTHFELRGPALAEPIAVQLAVPGRHNVANATCALTSLLVAGARGGPVAGPAAGGATSEPASKLPPLAELAAALASFPGMARRQERKGSFRGALVYDDYAHHPTEVDAVLAALRELPHRRLIAIFQPHLYSRTAALAPQFGRALAGADVVGVLDVYAAREEPVGELEGVDGRLIATAAADAAPGKRVLWLADHQAAIEQLATELGEGDLVVTIGAGDVFEVADALVAAEADPGE